MAIAKHLNIDPKLVCRYRIPDLEGSCPGRLNTVLQDEADNLFCTDEINHRLFAITPSGGLLWSIGGQGSQAGSFWYPKGLALGNIQVGGSLARSLAVCDSWNRRIQHFDLQGKFLVEWKLFKEQPFGELADIRFISPSGDIASGMWIVLDRGNHRLNYVSVDGRSLGQIGQALPPELEANWARHLVNSAFNDLAGNSQGIPVQFDPLYFPERIAGCNDSEIYMWQPGNAALKQVISHNILTIAEIDFCEGECLSSDTTLRLSWHAPSGFVRLQSHNKEICYESRMEGVPVFSDLPPNEFWIFHAGYLNRYRWDLPTLPTMGAAEIAAIRATEEFRHASDLPGLREFVQEVLATVDSCIAMGKATLQLPLMTEKSESEFETLQKQLRAQETDLASLSKRLSRSEEIPWKSLLFLFLAPPPNSAASAGLASDFSKGLKLLAEPVESGFMRLLGCMDLVAMRRMGLEKGGEGSQKLHQIVSQAESSMLATALELQKWLQGTPGYLTRIQSPADHSDRSRYFHMESGTRCALIEATRYSLENPQSEQPLKPFAIAAAPDGHLFVTLFGRNSIVHLDPKGRMLQLLGTDMLRGPIGVVWDAPDRLWVVEYYGDRVSIFDPQTGKIVASFQDDVRSRSIHSPIGICRDRAGRILVADSGNARIVRISPSGSIETHCEGPVSGLGNFIHPINLIPQAVGGDGVWIVDDRRHEVVLIGADGKYVRKIGGCGLQRNCLIMPQAAAQFQDGVLAVLQNQMDRTLIFYSPEGEELFRQPLDFVPGNLLAVGELLLISEFDGSHIRVFERTNARL